MANYNDWVSDEGLREGCLANWLIMERVTGLGGSCIQLTQSGMSAHGLIVVKEITHTHRRLDSIPGPRWTGKQWLESELGL